MSKRLELKIDKDLYDKLEIYRIKNNLEDKQDAIRMILENKLTSLLERLKNFFK